MKNLLAGLVAGALLMAGGVIYGLHTQQSFGQFNPTGGGTYYLQASINTSQSTILLTSFTESGSNIPYTMTYLNSDVEYATINPDTTRSEFVSFTGVTQNANGTALLTGVTRGLERSYPYTASTTLAFAFPGQTKFILSAPPQFFNEYAVKRNAQSITGVWTYASTSAPQYDAGYSATGNQFVPFTQLQNIVLQGAATSTESQLGLVQLVGAAQVGSSTASSTAGAPLVLTNKMATSTPGTLCTGNTIHCIPVALAGKLSQLFLDLTAAFTFSGGLTSSATTTLACSNVLSNACKFNTVPYQFPSSQGSNSTILTNNGSGVLSWGTPTHYNFSTSTAMTANNATATSTTSWVIPAGTMGASSTIQMFASVSLNQSGNCTLQVRDSTGATLASVAAIAPSANGFSGNFSGIIYNNSSVASQVGFMQVNAITSGNVTGTQPGFNTSAIQTSTTNFASAVTLYFVLVSADAHLCTFNSGVISATP